MECLLEQKNEMWSIALKYIDTSDMLKGEKL